MVHYIQYQNIIEHEELIKSEQLIDWNIYFHRK